MNEKNLNIRPRLATFLALLLLSVAIVGLWGQEPTTLERPPAVQAGEGQYEVSVDGSIAIQLPSEVFFDGPVVFQDLRSGNEMRRLEVRIAIENEVSVWKKRTYSGEYIWNGNPASQEPFETEYSQDDGRPSIALIFELYHKVNGEWIQESWSNSGTFMTLNHRIAGREPASLTLTDERILISVDTILELGR